MTRPTKRLAFIAFALALGTMGCHGATDGERAPGPVSFQADPSSDEAAVFLAGRTEGDRVVVDVIARGVSDLHGAAFRMKWDPAALAFVEARGGGPWSKEAVLLAKEALPGQLAVAWSEKGEAAGHDATAPLVLGTLVFEAKSRKGTTLSFRVDRSAIVDHRGKTAPVAWRAGNIPAR